MGRQNCGMAQAASVDDVQGRQNPVQGDEDSGNANIETTIHTCVTKDDCASLEGIGLTYNVQWNVLTCNRCHHIVDKSMIENHLTNLQKLEIHDKSAITEQELDDSNDEYAGRTGFGSGAFRPGAAVVDGVAVVDGYKCVLYEGASLQHRYVQSKEAMRLTASESIAIELCPARVQAFYGRSAPNPQLRYVEVAEHVTTLTAPETDDFTKFGIPANVQFSTHPTQLNDSL
ncbi:hypothetical protein V1505DRAFT_411626 [Lipomyces doorenjongii]